MSKKPITALSIVAALVAVALFGLVISSCSSATSKNSGQPGIEEQSSPDMSGCPYLNAKAKQGQSVKPAEQDPAPSDLNDNESGCPFHDAESQESMHQCGQGDCPHHAEHEHAGCSGNCDMSGSTVSEE